MHRGDAITPVSGQPAARGDAILAARAAKGLHGLGGRAAFVGGAEDK
ncbi:hypothetical protein OV079_21165 [Nannocystis pusilla]|uniref:Uncharacterized protein n=1 Tax=Nannocystis pusilla TaxID=889268 RepID=A0A9X3IYG7_9BACT|nr:hypothetical protein [Nannocystis pusilla]MCY1008020.1 hypothetical protein [Nannocystis pusilla]